MAHKSLEDVTTFLCELIIQTSFPLCLPFQKLLSIANSSSANPIENDRFAKSLKLIITSLKCVKEWKQCLTGFVSEQKQENSQTLSDEVLQSDHTKFLIVNNLRKILFNKNADVSEKFFFKLNLELLTKYLPKFSVLFDSKTFEMASKIDSNSSESYVALIRSFEIFGLYFDIFISKSNAELNSDQDQDLVNNCFNILEIDSLEKNLKKIIPKLLMLDELKPVTNDLNSIDLAMCSKYLKFLIKYLNLKENEQYMDERTSGNDTSDQELIDLNLKIVSDKETNKVINLTCRFFILYQSKFYSQKIE